MNHKTTTQKERRGFLKQLSMGSLTALAVPVFANSKSFALMPDPAASVVDEKYWEQIKKQFAVPSNLIMLNAANLCPARLR